MKYKYAGYSLEEAMASAGIKRDEPAFEKTSDELVIEIEGELYRIVEQELNIPDEIVEADNGDGREVVKKGYQRHFRFLLPKYEPVKDNRFQESFYFLKVSLDRFSYFTEFFLKDGYYGRKVNEAKTKHLDKLKNLSTEVFKNFKITANGGLSNENLQLLDQLSDTIAINSYIALGRNDEFPKFKVTNLKRALRRNIEICALKCDEIAERIKRLEAKKTGIKAIDERDITAELEALEEEFQTLSVKRLASETTLMSINSVDQLLVSYRYFERDYSANSNVFSFGRNFWRKIKDAGAATQIAINKLRLGETFQALKKWATPDNLAQAMETVGFATVLPIFGAMKRFFVPETMVEYFDRLSEENAKIYQGIFNRKDAKGVGLRSDTFLAHYLTEADKNETVMEMIGEIVKAPHPLRFFAKNHRNEIKLIDKSDPSAPKAKQIAGLRKLLINRVGKISTCLRDLTRVGELAQNICRRMKYDCHYDDNLQGNETLFKTLMPKAVGAVSEFNNLLTDKRENRLLKRALDNVTDLIEKYKIGDISDSEFRERFAGYSEDIKKLANSLGLNKADSSASPALQKVCKVFTELSLEFNLRCLDADFKEYEMAAKRLVAISSREREDFMKAEDDFKNAFNVVLRSTKAVRSIVNSQSYDAANNGIEDDINMLIACRKMITCMARTKRKLSTGVNLLEEHCMDSVALMGDSTNGQERTQDFVVVKKWALSTFVAKDWLAGLLSGLKPQTKHTIA